jgi:MFS family permease
MFIFQLMSVHIFPHAIDIGLSEIGAAIILSIISISSTFSRLLAGTIADRIGHRLTLFISTVILTLSLIVLFFSKVLWHFYIFSILFGAAWGGVGVVQVSLIAEYFGFQSLGAILGSLEFLLTTGGAIGVYLAGIIFDTTGTYTISFVICLGQAILVMLFSFMLMRYTHTGTTY